MHAVTLGARKATPRVYPGGASSGAMPWPCNSGGDLLQATRDFAADFAEDDGVHIFPVYYRSDSTTWAYYEDLATGDGQTFNPSTPEELCDVFAEIVWHSKVAMVPR